MSFSRVLIHLLAGVLLAVTAVADSLPREPEMVLSKPTARTECRAFQIGLTPEYAARQRREDARQELAAREAKKTALELRAYVVSRSDAKSRIGTPSHRARAISATELVQASVHMGRPATAAVIDANTELNATVERRYYIYDPEGRLIAETEVTSGSNPRIQYEYVWFGNIPVAQIEQPASGPAVISYYFTDHLGTPIIQTNEFGQIVWQAEYEPFGRIYAMRFGESKYQPLRFPGQIADIGGPEPDTYYNVHRYYRASWGRYTQPDPVFTAGRADYTYAFANPIRFIDPKGLTPQPFWRNEDEKCLLCTVYAESRGQSTACQQAVASVILNRLAGDRARGRVSDVCSVVSAPGQFDGYNNANYRRCADSNCRPQWPRELEDTFQNFQNGFPVAPEGATFFGNNTPAMTAYFGGTLGLTRVPYPACPIFSFWQP